MKNKCCLCKMEARTLCESDEASLCWKCDSKVHGANFLVARHIRYLLCAGCHSPTPWSASGPCLSPSVSLCQRCSVVSNEEEGENEVVASSPPSCSSQTTHEYDTGDDELESLHRPFVLQEEEKGEMGLKGRRSEEEKRRVKWRMMRSGRVGKRRYRRSCVEIDVDSSDNVSRTT